MRVYERVGANWSAHSENAGRGKQSTKIFPSRVAAGGTGRVLPIVAKLTEIWEIFLKVMERAS